MHFHFGVQNFSSLSDSTRPTRPTRPTSPTRPNRPACRQLNVPWCPLGCLCARRSRAASAPHTPRTLRLQALPSAASTTWAWRHGHRGCSEPIPGLALCAGISLLVERRVSPFGKEFADVACRARGRTRIVGTLRAALGQGWGRVRAGPTQSGTRLGRTHSRALTHSGTPRTRR